jgi:hypothetical protein
MTEATDRAMARELTVVFSVLALAAACWLLVASW